MGPMSTDGGGGWAQLRSSWGPLGLGVWDPTEQPGRGEGGHRSTDRLMAPALHTIGFALPSLPALGKGRASWELSWMARATGPGPPGLIRSGGVEDVGSQATQCPEGPWLRPERQGWGVGGGMGATGPLS